jgi:hypothetical protein
MSYTFALIKAHPQGESGWCLVIPRDAFDLSMEMHGRVIKQMALKFFKDPHLFNDGEPRREDSPFYHPIKLAAGWMNTCLRGLTEYGTVYMNRATGLVFGDGITVLETRESDALEFPTSDTKDGVKITISMWGGGEHYYLSASNNQVFAQPKYDHYDEALAEARKYAHPYNIEVSRGGYMYKTEGD